jgi:CyaY protein
MTESEYLALAEGALRSIESGIEVAAEAADVDLECTRSGNVLEIEFIDVPSKIIINTQAPMQEIWVAARAGGYHYKYREGQWINTRDNSELFSALSALVSAQGGKPLHLSP